MQDVLTFAAIAAEFVLIVSFTICPIIYAWHRVECQPAHPETSQPTLKDEWELELDLLADELFPAIAPDIAVPHQINPIVEQLFDNVPNVPVAVVPAPKRPRGRPRGSKNKTKVTR